MKPETEHLRRIVEGIEHSGHSIYDHIDDTNSGLWISTPDLQDLLQTSMVGISLAGLPLRTRSKVVKQHMCRALGYPVPRSFRKTIPRFPGQDFDVYVQKSDNLQIWNDDISRDRRYVIIRVDKDDIISNIWVVTGDRLSLLDTSGRLTIKHQAHLRMGDSPVELVTVDDTALLDSLTASNVEILQSMSPTNSPRAGELISITDLFERLTPLIGTTFTYSGYDQERNRAASLVRIVCKALGYSHYRDSGQFPDITHQLLEIKLQTSRTIDLGMVRPDSREILEYIPDISGQQIRCCDVRYALFYGNVTEGIVTINQFVLTTGTKFFERFPQYQGNIVNRKLQIHLVLPPVSGAL